MDEAKMRGLLDEVAAGRQVAVLVSTGMPEVWDMARRVAESARYGGLRVWRAHGLERIQIGAGSLVVRSTRTSGTLHGHELDIVWCDRMPTSADLGSIGSAILPRKGELRIGL